MKYKEFKNTEEYRFADVLEVYSEKTGEEFDFDFPEKELEEMEVINFMADVSGYVSVILRD